MNRFALWWATTPAPLRWLIAGIGGLYALFLVTALVASLVPAAGIVVEVFDALAFAPMRPAYVWSFATHAFVYPAVGFFALLNVVVALLFLSTLGRDALDVLGVRWFMGALAAAVLGASLFAFGVHSLLGQPPRVFGPWTLVLGLAMALGVRFPQKSVGMLLVGNVRLVVLVPVLVLLGALLSASVVPVIGDIGAALGAAAYAGLGTTRFRLPDRMPGRTDPPRGASARGVGVRSGVAAVGTAEAGRGRTTRRGGASAAQEVDRILEKISASGMNSLTSEERKTLEDASRG